jgi:hypothetical protein
MNNLTDFLFDERTFVARGLRSDEIRGVAGYWSAFSIALTRRGLGGCADNWLLDRSRLQEIRLGIPRMP